MSAPGRSVFLVVEPDVPIAGDLHETPSALHPDAAVARTRDAAAARAMLARGERLSAAFPAAPSGELPTGGLPRMAEARGGRVVVLDAPRDAAPVEGPRLDGVRTDGRLHTGRPHAARTIAGFFRAST